MAKSAAEIAVQLRKLADALDALGTKSIKPKKRTSSAVGSEWVDARRLAEHIGFSYQTTLGMADNGKIPGKAFQSGKKTFWRFRLSDVDAALAKAEATNV
jgi:hypothetical protein